ncbi:MAG: 6-carboxytetrahydropterin synthase [Bacteroidetes bacterium]|nr:6-carboxytetrahydropterin synthase [Bacteroidota bacterium]MBS1539626.1 6-carboxytetrahydropterin synthase [Bacteroidota bacterium]
MISLTRIFRFEAAHAIYEYPGSCARVHGHSYELHVTIRSKKEEHGYIDRLGIIFDFKDLKKIVSSTVDQLDHKLILSKTYVKNSSHTFAGEEITLFDYEPTAENLLIFFRDRIKNDIPESVSLLCLKLYETRDSYAEWMSEETKP